MNQQLEPDWQVEILVADGRSNDGTREILQRYCEKTANVRLVDNPGQIVSTGLNTAIEASTGEVIIRMDAHTVYSEDYVKECVNVLLESGADNVGGPWIAQGRGCLGRAIAAAFQSPFCAGGGKAHNAMYEGEVDTVYLGCWRRSAFERFGLFDPDLVRNQDDEFNFRMRIRGGRVVQSPRIRSIYTPRSSVTRLFKQYLQYGFWKVVVIRKHGAVAAWRHLVPAMFVASILVACALSVLFAAFGWTAMAVVTSRVVFAELVVYALACVIATIPFARSLGLRATLALPGVIAVHHIAYGLGFLLGMLHVQLMKFEFMSLRPAKFFSALTR
jgi:glycosyltransferase involved in cell wall biosynthesis